MAGCFSKDQVYLDGILKILRYRDKINFPLLMALGKVRQLYYLCLVHQMCTRWLLLPATSSSSSTTATG